jgi:hypothetical protein
MGRLSVGLPVEKEWRNPVPILKCLFQGTLHLTLLEVKINYSKTDDFIPPILYKEKSLGLTSLC